MWQPPPSALYLIAGRARARGNDYLGLIAAALDGGVDVLQMREKRGARGDLLELGRRLHDLTQRHGIPFVVNDDPHLARDLSAEGLHLGQSDTSPEAARGIVGEDVFLGLSTHSEDEILAARGRGLDLIGVGPLYPTRTKENAEAPVGVDLLRRASVLAPELPAFGIGGIDHERAQKLAARGCRRLAVSAAILEADDPFEVAFRLKRILTVVPAE